MAKRKVKSKQQAIEPVAICDQSLEVVANCDHLENIDIRTLIHVVRNQQVLVDRDLAMLYGVETKTLNQAVKRNINRFPADFMFQLTEEEHRSLRSQNVTLNQGIASLRSQIATSKNGRGKHSKYLSYVFTRNGVAMLSSVLRSETAVGVSATIHTRYNEQFLTDLKKHNAQYSEIQFVQLPRKNHDRFLIIDDKVHFPGASLKDMGASLCAVSEMSVTPETILGVLK